MNVLRNLIQQLKTVWAQAGAAQQRAALTTAGLLLAAAVIGVGIWSSRPQYVILAANLSLADSRDLAGKLEAKGINYRTSPTGATLEVSKSDLSKARVAAGDLLQRHGVTVGAIDSSIISDPGLNSHKIHQQKEQELAQTLMSFEGIEEATVHIGRPEASPFLDRQQDVSASVVLKLHPNARFGTRAGAAVVATVSKAVDGLKAADVHVTDTHGRVLSTPVGGVAADIAGQLEYRQRVEADLAANAEMMLSRLVGYGNAIVRVTADVDFDTMTTTTMNYDPDNKVPRSENIETKKHTKADPRAATAGAGGNQGGNPAEQQDTLLDEENIRTEYELGTTSDTIVEAGGGIKRLTVAAVVDLAAIEDKENAAEVTPDKLERIIKQAVGFDINRSDEIEVLIAPLADAPSTAAPAPAHPWADYEWLLRNASLGMGSLVALVLGWLILRKVQPQAAAPATDSATLDTRRTRALASMSDSVRRNPEQLKDALQLWLADGEATSPTAKAA